MQHLFDTQDPKFRIEVNVDDLDPTKVEAYLVTTDANRRIPANDIYAFIEVQKQTPKLVPTDFTIAADEYVMRNIKDITFNSDMRGNIVFNYEDGTSESLSIHDVYIPNLTELCKLNTTVAVQMGMALHIRKLHNTVYGRTHQRILQLEKIISRMLTGKTEFTNDQIKSLLNLDEDLLDGEIIHNTP